MNGVSYLPYQAKKIVNIHKHIDGGWFWDKYSAHPYVGCQFGCDFCYSREPKYLPYENPDDFDRIIKAKVNAAELLRKELPKVENDLLMVGDWQPAEKKFRLSRKMLEVVLELGFPIILNERSPMVVEDLDIITDISKKSYAAIIFSLSFVAAPKAKRIFEPKSPAVELRLQTMEKFACAGITAGVAAMPILPFIADSNEDLELVVKSTKNHGGKFVLAGGLTMSGYQQDRYLGLLRKHYPGLKADYDKLYHGEYAPSPRYWTKIGLKVRELCVKYGIADRMPRPMFYEKLVTNKKVAERLFLKVYDLELEQALPQKIWAYRKAAWAADELKEDIGEVYRKSGIQGLHAIPGVGKSIAAEIEKCLKSS